MSISLTTDKIACIELMKQQVNRIEAICRRAEESTGVAVGVAIVPELDTLMAGLDALLEPDHAAPDDRLAAAEARADRWKRHACAWERYDTAFMTGTEADIDQARKVLSATEGQLREFGDLPGMEVDQ